MTSSDLLFLLTVGVVLLVAIGATALMIVKENERVEKLKTRLQETVAPSAKPTSQVEEDFSLVRTVSRVEQLKLKAAGIIGVDLKQAETYPIKWWLVPFITAGLTWFIMFIASHPLGHHLALWIIVKYAGTPVTWWMLTGFAFNWFTNRRNAKLVEQFPDALNTIVRCVRVGIPMAEALRTVAKDAMEPTKLEFSILADKVSIGIPLDIALRELGDRVKLTEYQFFATAITLQARSGGGITQTLETLSEVIRKRVGLKARGYALTAEARTSAMILSVLPFVAGGAIFVMQRSYIMLLFTTSGGQSVLGAAILLMCIGMGIIQFMISNVLK
ncbi:type II secretion system F family protein [Acidocella aromatica]|uniref:Tight adherence protein B n=1 Tax=Acidocella aromatica TaxID=1303579 RepID=A0A840V9X9_9PROT|nr:type II secretion system F family protein [Acidocella aromatica]MBB5372344.1 tight adherence protein B [Acidocella aromatica]